MNNYPRGSEWRKWDLHVHTPLSLVNHFNGANEEERWENFIKDLEQLPEEFKVIGINDYLFIDGYRKVLEYKESGRLKNIELFLPVIEFRIKKFAGHRDFKRVNLHVIFSNELEPDVVESQFLNALKSKYKLSPGLNGILWNGTITKESLEDLGKKIKQNIPPEELNKYGSDLEEGFNNLNLDEEDILEILSNNTFLKDKYLTAVGKTEWESLSWNDQSIAEKKDIINKVDLVFIASEDTKSFKRAKRKLTEQGVNDLLLDCSDAHYNFNSTNKDRIGNCFTWIKADPTFEGLKQIIYEPEDRVKIQEEKPEEKLPYQLIDSVQFMDSGKSFTTEKIYLNQNLTTIIGGKSTGKSILLREIARTINPNEVKKRLNEVQLEDYPIPLGDDFLVKWVDGREDKRTEKKNDYRKIIYIPQSYLNRLADREEQVSPIDKLVESILKEDEEIKPFFENIERKSYEIGVDISLKIEELFDNIQQYKNKSEEIKNVGDKKGIEKQIKILKEKIEELQEKGGLTQEDIEKYKQLKEKQDKLQQLKQNYSLKKVDFIKVKNLKKFGLTYEFKQIYNRHKEIKNESDRLLKEVESKLNAYLNNAINEISKKLSDFDEKVNGINMEIKPLTEKIKDKQLLNDKIKKLQEEKEKYNKIIEKEKALEEINNKISYLVNILAESFVTYYNIKNEFKSKIEKANSLGEGMNLKIVIKPKNKEFEESFINEIFNLKSIPNKYKNFCFDIENIENLKTQIEKLIVELLEEKIKLKSEYKNRLKEVIQRLLQDWFVLNYQIIYDGDTISEMSPGKKSFVLLRLIVELDKSKCPLLIDQPEDDLDNRSIYNEVVKFLKEKKKDRQIIIVTHNPNLVVTADAECVVVANQDGEKTKNREFKFEYIQGALENTFKITEERQSGEQDKPILYKQGIREHVCEILEGGEAAFINREKKYNIN